MAHVESCPICKVELDFEKNNGYIDCDDCGEKLEVVSGKLYVVPEEDVDDDEDYDEDEEDEDFEDEDDLDDED